MNFAVLPPRISGFDPQKWGVNLAKRLRIRLPEIIDHNGQLIADDLAALAADLPSILIAGADLAPSFGSDEGTYIAGTREPAIAPLLSSNDRLSCPAAIRDALLEFPSSYKEIRSHLLEVTGLFGAEVPFARVAGYSISEVATLLDLLRRAGAQGSIAISVIMARYVYGHATAHHNEMKAAITARGCHRLTAWFVHTLIALRAVMASLDILEAGYGERFAGAEARRPLEICRTRMGRALETLADARVDDFVGVAKRNGRALEIIRKLIERLEHFCLELPSANHAFDQFSREVCKPEKQENLDRILSSDQLDRRLNRLLSAQVEFDEWIPPVLQWSAAEDRRDWFLRFRTDGLFRLLLLRRLDEVVAKFPWFSARPVVFRHVPLGLPGVMAQLLELGRACEIGRELIWRMHEPGEEGRTARLGLKSAHQRINRAGALRSAILHGDRLGTAIMDGGVSHAMLARVMAGDFLASGHPLTQVRFGVWKPDAVAAFDDDRTVISTQRAEGDKQLHRLSSHHDNHYVRFYGRTVLEVVFGALFTIFKSSNSRRTASDMPDDGTQLPSDTLQVGKAILRNIDPSDIELQKFERDLRAGDRSGASPDMVGAHSVRKNLCQLKSRLHRSDVASSVTMHWGVRRAGNDRALLDQISAGVEAGSAPIGDLFLPILWFFRHVDLPIWSWMQAGAHVAAAPAAMTGKRDQIAFEVRQAHAWAPNLYLNALPTPLTARIASILAITPTWLSLDHKFAEIQ